MPKHIIAIVGMPGVGKSEATSIAAELLCINPVYFGGQVINELKRLQIPVNPENERVLREQLREQHGMAAMAILAKDEIKQRLGQARAVLIDGVYSGAEVEFIRENFCGRLVCIAIHSKKSLRYERLSQRKARPLGKHQVDERDISEITKLDKATPIALADYHLVNDLSLESLKLGISEIIKCIDCQS